MTETGRRTSHTEGEALAPGVHKFGGTSLEDGERIVRAASLIAGEPGGCVVVVSAMSGVTDGLTGYAEAVGAGRAADAADALARLKARHDTALQEIASGTPERDRVQAAMDRVFERLGALASAPGSPSDAELEDRAVAAGEDLCALLFACALRILGRPAEVVDARDIVRTDAAFGRARPDPEATAAAARSTLLEGMREGWTPVVQGFVGSTADERTTTLGRGGSDYTAALLASWIGCEVVHIWTDVDGVYSADPQEVEGSQLLPEIGFEEAVELAYFGARVLHPAAAKHAISTGVRVLIRNTFRPEQAGTVVLPDRWGEAEVAAVAFKPDVTLIKVRSHPAALPFGFLARVFEILARHEVPVDLVATSHSSTAFTIDRNEELDEVCAELSDFADVDVLHDLATVTVVGHGLMKEPGTDALIFWAVERTPVHLVSQASDVSLSLVVEQDTAADLVRRLHMALIEFREEERKRARWEVTG